MKFITSYVTCEQWHYPNYVPDGVSLGVSAVRGGLLGAQCCAVITFPLACILGHGAISYRKVENPRMQSLGFGVGLADYALYCVDIGMSSMVTGARRLIKKSFFSASRDVPQFPEENRGARKEVDSSRFFLTMSAGLGVLMVCIRIPLCFAAAGVGAAIGFAQGVCAKIF